MDTLRKDVSFALRGLARSPGFVAVIVATLGLGIGANVAIFTVVDGMMLEALPYRDPRGVVRIWDTKLSQGWDESSISPLNFRDWQERNRTFEDMAIFQGRSFNLSDESEPERIVGVTTTANVFGIVGVAPSLGRDFREQEDDPGADPVVIVSDRLWQRRFAGNPAIVGSTLRLDGAAHTVVGIMPARFFFPSQEVDAWIPTAFPPSPRRAATGASWRWRASRGRQSRSGAGGPVARRRRSRARAPGAQRGLECQRQGGDRRPDGR